MPSHQQFFCARCNQTRLFVRDDMQSRHKAIGCLSLLLVPATFGLSLFAIQFAFRTWRCKECGEALPRSARETKIIRYGVAILAVVLVIGALTQDRREPRRVPRANPVPVSAQADDQPAEEPASSVKPVEKAPAPPAKPIIHDGDRVVLMAGDGRRVPVATSWDDYKRLMDVLAIDDAVGLQELAQARKVSFVEEGTKALMLDKGILGSQVRVISPGRPLDGKAMWIDASHAKLEK